MKKFTLDDEISHATLAGLRAAHRGRSVSIYFSSEDDHLKPRSSTSTASQILRSNVFEMITPESFDDPARLLSNLESAHQQGDVFAAPAALSVCQLERRTIPYWVIQSVWKMANQQVRQRKRLGRTGNFLARSRQDAIHKLRWATVLCFRDNRETWDQTYIKASVDLQGTRAQGSAGTMRWSYKRVRKSDWLKTIAQNPNHEARRIYDRRESYLEVG